VNQRRVEVAEKMPGCLSYLQWAVFGRPRHLAQRQFQGLGLVDEIGVLQGAFVADQDPLALGLLRRGQFEQGALGTTEGGGAEREIDDLPGGIGRRRRSMRHVPTLLIT